MQPTQEPAPSSTALLDALRKRLMPEVNAGAAQRLSDVGIGMMTSNSPDFLSALGKGLQAGNTAETNRIQMLRQAAETEEQSLYRKAQIELERAKQTYDQDPNNPHTRAALMQAEASMISAGAAATRAGREARDPWQVIGTDESGSAVVANMRDPSQRQTLSGVEPTSFGVVSRRAAARQQLDARTLGGYRVSADAAALRAFPMQGQERERTAEANRLYESYVRAGLAGTAPFQEGAVPAPTNQQRVNLPLVGSAPRRAPTE